MISIRIMLYMFPILAFNPTLAEGAVTDLGIEVAVEPAGVTPPGTQLVVVVTITNQGPDAGSARFSLRPTNNGTALSFPPLETPALLSGPCTGDPIFDPPPGEFFPPWIIQDIPAGESRACEFGFRVLETDIISQVMRWEVRPRGTAEDPNDANNIADVLLQFASLPTPIPVPTISAWMLLLLVVLFIVTALRPVGQRVLK